ncbi:chain-length determining protein [Agrobacterium sp. TS43]|uniref:polysaccharide biosynthesis protein UppB n=1 Tax=Agrobacterium TaxID=357 RepID=UPI0003600D2D|nr:MULTISPECIES: polysaccharide biosynthesis protein UppB [Agrobacterium]EPR19865.1 chain-length determining protein [Agrobacterium radiobacter DSM 30147]KDR88784.1 chain-length determining protein [Agrobacterium tumefaciens GW4]KVK47294.1 chain-length determining protein [Agrobacterium sp. LY4]KVK47836.1 chain-length determining protein [Agrobacterium sp. JL28]KVK60610.1 chain-length determining protein [Agrobacterium sp. TS45]
MNGDRIDDRDVDIDLAQLVAAIWQRKGRIAAITLLAGGAAFVISSMMSPAYKGEARVLIESRAASFGASQQSNAPAEPVLDELTVSSQVQILQSVDLIKQVAKDMKLYELDEFDPEAHPSLISQLLVAVGVKKDPLQVLPEERVLKAFREKLQVYQVESSRVITVEFSSQDPKLAAAIPNEMMKAYIALQSGAKLDTSTEAARWLEPEIANLREKVREADRKVADYRASSDLLSAGQGETLATRQLGDISTELGRIRGERANAEARAEGVRSALASGRPLDTFPDVVGSPTIQRLKENETTIRSQISDLSSSLLEGHPRIRALRNQLDGIQRQIQEETRKVLASLENEANVSRLRERQLVQQLNMLKSESVRAGEQQVGLNDLEREASAQRQLLETYLARYREATSRAGSVDSTPADARVISTAVEPREPYFPKTGAITIVVTLAAFLLSCIVVMLVELFTGRALKPMGRNQVPPLSDPPSPSRAPADPDKTTDVPEQSVAARHETIQPAARAMPVAAYQPVAEEEERHLPAVAAAAAMPALPVEDVAAAKEEAMEEEVDTDDDFSIDAVAGFLATRLAKPVAAIVSPAGDSGSTTSVMLARALSEMGRSVVLVDMTASACPTRLMAPEAGLPGVMDLLAGAAAFGETIHGDRLSDAHIVPRGNAQPREAMRAIDRLTMILGALSDAYDTVLVECGAVQISSLGKMLRNLPAEIIVSVPGKDSELLEKTLGELVAEGYEQALPMTGMRKPDHLSAA